MLQQPQVVHFQQQPQHQQQHSHTAAGAASQRQLPPDAGLAEAWRAQHAAAISQWRLLSQPGQDETSCIILSCSSSQQLLGVAQELLKQPASKWHYARLAAMAAVLTAPQQTSAVGASQQATIQQQQQHNAAAGQDLDLFVHWRGSNGNGSGSSSSSGVAAQVQHWQLGQHSSPVEQQQQQQYGPCAHTQLACKVMEAVTAPCASSGVPALHAMWGTQLTEVLHAVQLLQQQQPGHSTLSEQHQPQLGSLLKLLPLLQRQQQRLQQVLAAMPEPALLSAVHGCTSVQQLQSVVALAGEWFSPLQLKAGFVQLARLVPASSSSSSIVVDVWQQLLAVLPLHLPALQPHQCASILWSMGQLQPTLGTSSGSTEAASASSSGSGSARQLIDVQQQLLQGALAGLERLNPRVCAQLLHGAARLQLQLPAGSLQVLQQHTQQQLQLCDPQALACMLWSFATLHSSGSSPGPNPDWLAAFYSSSWRWLQQSSSAPSHSSSNSNSTFSPHWQQRQERQQQWQHKDVAVCFEPVELSSLLTAVCRLQLQPPSGWLAAVADSSSRQIGSFQQQELGLVLWGFARLQYAPPRGFITAAASRLQQLGPGGFDPQVLSLLIYGATRLLCWHQPCEQQLLRGCERQVLAGGVAQLGQWSGHDLALLAWSLGRQQQQQQQKQQGRQQAQLLGDVLLPALVQASTAKLLQQQQFTPQGVSMLLWGLGTVLQASVAEAARSRGREASSSTSTSGSNGTSSSSAQPVPQNQQQEQQASAAALPDQAMLVALLEAASVAVTQHAKAFSGHELSQLVWGIGALARQAAFPAHHTSSSSSSRSSSVVSTPGRRGPLPVPAAAECLDLLFCQLLDASDHLSNYQLAAALQGFCWAHHPRGLDLLHLALQSRARNARAAAVQPQELLLFLRACTTYKYVPEGSAWAGVVAAADRVRTQLRPDELAQLLNLLGKLQMQSNRRARQRAAQAAAASAAEAAAAVSAWQTKHEQRRQAWMSTYHQKQQVLQHVAFEPLVPQVLLEQLVVQAAGCCFQHCSSRDVSLMLWGVSHLQRQHQHQLLSLPLQQQHHQWAGPDSSTSAATHAGPLAPLLGAVYPYTLQQLTSFAPGNLATLLYALHRLRARPEGAWLQAVALHFDEGRLSSMDGQSLAVLGLALAGLNWVPPKAWLGSYVRAVAAADRRGVLVTTWQRRCISNSLAALNPLAGHLWLP
jgi:hypothetical protein